LFNLLRAAAASEPTVLVVEGFFDCLKVHQAGIRSVVALMGAALYESQQPALEQFRRVILMLDGDAAGRRAGANIAARLQPRCSVWVIQLAAYTQPDQLPAETTRHVLEVHTTTPQYCAALGQAR
jgi:DNA primase